MIIRNSSQFKNSNPKVPRGIVLIGLASLFINSLINFKLSNGQESSHEPRWLVFEPSSEFVAFDSESFSSNPTPEFNFAPKRGQQEDPNEEFEDRGRSSSPAVAPTAVYFSELGSHLDGLEVQRPSSPVYNYLHYHPNSNEVLFDSNADPSDSVADKFGFVEQGSGEEPATSPNDSLQRQLIEPTQVLNVQLGGQTTPAFYSSSSSDDKQLDSSSTDSNGLDRAPELKMRLPKLNALAGHVWRYFIPEGTFVDEDGDLRGLKSTILLKNDAPNGGSSQENNADGQYFSWLHYDRGSKLLYAFPMDDNAGRHELLLMVEDKLGQVANESLEIYVRQHQSLRAFTHTIRLEGIRWDRSKFPTMVDALGELVKRLSSRLYFDHPFANILVHQYQLDTSSSSFNISWSNSSLPVHPCNLDMIEQLLTPLVDGSDLLLGLAANMTNLKPSDGLINALAPEFKPNAVSIQLQSACEQSDQSSSLNSHDSISQHEQQYLRLGSKIGRVDWMLGEPIEFRIPPETFELLDKQSSKLKLSLHTSDGLALEKDPRYDFLDFDPETETLYGLPYDSSGHIGQRELRLTALHESSGQKVREVFVINIEPQDLTRRNNRAFKMSIYFESRAGVFGPRERVALCHKISAAFKTSPAGTTFRNSNWWSASSFGSSEFVVLSVEKFSVFEQFETPPGAQSGIPSSNSILPTNEATKIDKYSSKVFKLTSDSSFPAPATVSENQQLVAVLEEQAETESYLDPSKFLYKLTWTNETIGQRGDCPVEVINDNIFNRLDRNLYELESTIETNENEALGSEGLNDQASSTSRFYQRLLHYFEPESGLIDLRFEPSSACSSALEAQDVGLADLADQLDRAALVEQSDVENPDVNAIDTPSSTPHTVNFQTAGSSIALLGENTGGNGGELEEYWLVLALIVALMFVIVVFALGMHTYKKNQDKSFELQVRLAQARQNSMFLSSMMLANQLTPADGVAQANGQLMVANNQAGSVEQGSKSVLLEDDQRNRRRPVILDSDRQFLISNSNQASPQHLGAGQFATLGRLSSMQQQQPMLQSAVHLHSAGMLDLGRSNGSQFKTLALQPGSQLNPSDRATPVHLQMPFGSQQALMNGLMLIPGQQHGEQSQQLKQRSMTLNRKTSTSNSMIGIQSSPLHHSQSILTVASQVGSIANAFVPPNLVLAQPIGAPTMVCAPTMLAYPAIPQQQQQQLLMMPTGQSVQLTNGFAKPRARSPPQQQQQHQQQQQQATPIKAHSPSHSSSTSGSASGSQSTASSVATSARQSVISNPNYVRKQNHSQHQQQLTLNQNKLSTGANYQPGMQ